MLTMYVCARVTLTQALTGQRQYSSMDGPPGSQPASGTSSVCCPVSLWGASTTGCFSQTAPSTCSSPVSHCMRNVSCCKSEPAWAANNQTCAESIVSDARIQTCAESIMSDARIQTCTESIISDARIQTCTESIISDTCTGYSQTCTGVNWY